MMTKMASFDSFDNWMPYTTNHGKCSKWKL
jgi:hypothetical protein